MIARTVIDVEPLVWTVILLGFFAAIALVIWATNEVIRFEIERRRQRRGRRSA